MSSSPLNAASLRLQLMAPEPMQRARALHAVECMLAQTGEQRPRWASEAEKFVSRGLPFYQPQAAQYGEWVERTVTYWERLQPSA
ncbi:MAG: hypothetical protein V4739_08135 [Pseudomonadota bacterium]